MVTQRFSIDPVPSQVYHRSVTVSEHREIVNGRLVVEQSIRLEHQDPQPLRSYEDLVSMMSKPSATVIAAVPKPEKTRQIKSMLDLARRILDM